MGSSVPDEALLPSDRGERSETFSLGGEGYPRGIAKGCPLKTPRTPAELRQVSFLGGAAPSGRNIFSANRSKMLLSPPKKKAAEGLRPAAFRTIDNVRERGYNKDKGNTVSRRLALRIGYRNSRILWPRAAISYCSETGQ